LIITLPDAGEIHPAELVTVKLYVPAFKPDIVVLTVEPGIAPGLIVQVPVGSPLKTTLPVATAQVGWVIMPIVGADGVAGCALMTILADGTDIQPDELVTVYVYVPDASPKMVVLVPVPVVIVPPGVLVNVQVPDDGKPLKSTLPVGTVQVG
jgi:hypothetical protein